MTHRIIPRSKLRVRLPDDAPYPRPERAEAGAGDALASLAETMNRFGITPEQIEQLLVDASEPASVLLGRTIPPGPVTVLSRAEAILAEGKPHMPSSFRKGWILVESDDEETV